MGPQSGSCGYHVLAGVGDKFRVASMGPQSGSCGYVSVVSRLPSPISASMGPQSGSCGYQLTDALAGPDREELQWVHSLVAVVIRAARAAMTSPRRRFNGSTVW